MPPAQDLHVNLVPLPDAASGSIIADAREERGPIIFVRNEQEFAQGRLNIKIRAGIFLLPNLKDQHIARQGAILPVAGWLQLLYWRRERCYQTVAGTCAPAGLVTGGDFAEIFVKISSTNLNMVGGKLKLGCRGVIMASVSES